MLRIRRENDIKDASSGSDTDSHFDEFDETLHELFPGAVSIGEFLSDQIARLALKGFTKDNVIPIIAQCRDELTKDFSDAVERQLGMSFSIGGLAGMVFAGRTAFGAAIHHAPNADGRDKFVVFAGPHIGISEHGEVGKVFRKHRAQESDACGSLKAVISEIAKGKINLQLDTDDLEQSLVKQSILSQLKFGQKLSLYDITQKAAEITTTTVTEMMNECVDKGSTDFIIFTTVLIHGPGGHHFVYLKDVSGIVEGTSVDSRSWFESREIPPQFSGRLQDIFPGAIDSGEFLSVQTSRLASHGFRRDNSIAIISQCRDELTRDFVNQIESHLGHSFQIGGLAGMVFAGRTAFGAAMHHAPNEDGIERYIVFCGPHIAISQTGEVGSVKRPNRPGKSGACGSLLSLLSEMEKGPVNLQLDTKDLEQSFVKTQLLSELNFTDEISLPLLTQKIADITFRTCQRILGEICDKKKSHYVIYSTVLIHGPDGSNFVQFRDLAGVINKTAVTKSTWKIGKARRLSAMISPSSKKPPTVTRNESPNMLSIPKVLGF